MLDRWLSAKNVNNEFKQLRELVLIEQFKGCIHADIKTHLDERDVNNLEDAATTADDFALTHKLSIRAIQIGLTKVSPPMVRKALRKEIHSQVPQVREIKILLVPNQSQGMVFKHQ